MKLLMAGDFYCFVLFYYWNILLLGCFFVAVDFSICANLFAIGNILGLPIILDRPNLGKKHKNGTSQKFRR